jgi:hypothetical protein
MQADWVGVDVLASGVRLAVGVYVLVGGLSVGVTLVVGVAAVVSRAVGRMVDTNAVVKAVFPIGCALPIGWQEDKSVSRRKAMTKFLNTFGVYHKNTAKL